MDILLGGAGSDTLKSMEGLDVLIGGRGNDSYLVNDPLCQIIENAGSGQGIDLVNSSIDYTLGNHVENLVLTGAAIMGAGNGLNNTITGNAGNNVLDGGAGADSLVGGLGDDRYIIDSSKDVVTERAGQGIDTVMSSINTTLRSNLENLILTGGNAIRGTGNGLDNLILGHTGNNVLKGLAGNDVLVGGQGVDLMTGGSGLDIFRFEALSDSGVGKGNRDQIQDFSLLNDKIDLSMIDADTTVNGEGDAAFAWKGSAGFSGIAGELHSVSAGRRTRIEGDLNGDAVADFQIELVGTLHLNSAHFVL